MKIKTTRFGTIAIEKDQIIRMPFGIPGFPYQKQFVLFQHKKDSPFLWYQSIEDPSLAFAIIDPLLFKPDYKVNLNKILAELSWEKEMNNNQIKLYVILNVPKGSPDKITANLIGPILMNQTTREAVQVIISDSSYSHKFPLI